MDKNTAQVNFDKTKILYSLIIIGLAMVVLMLYYPLLRYDTKGADLYFIYLDSLSISNGENPYIRIHDGNMYDNQKYTTYFPLFFIIGAGAIKAGIAQYDSFDGLFRRLSFVFSFVIGLIIFQVFTARGKPAWGIIAMIFWLFNRWTMYVAYVGQIEFFAMMPFIISFLIIDKKPKTAMLLLSLSLALKQMAIFTLPLMVFHAAEASVKIKNGGSARPVKPAEYIKPFIIMSLLAVSIVTIASLPFLIDDPRALIKSILFSSVRAPMDETPGMNLALSIYGLRGRTFFMLFMLILWGVSLFKKIDFPESIFLCMLIFIGFNPVFFNQYFVWVIPFLFFVIAARIENNQSADAQ